jgi:hypothetical protein
MKTITSLALLLVLLLAAGAALADDEAKTLADMDGKEIYKAVCKTCHGPDADAGEYTPMSLIMEQWDEFFQDTFVETHAELACPQDETKKVTDVIEGKTLEKVQKFCVDHAADSEQPMTCG